MANNGFLYRTFEAIEDNMVGVIIAGFILAGIGAWTGDMYSKCKDAEVQKARIQAGLELKVGDYNGNQLLDKYYEIDGKKIPVEVDGKPVAEYFKNKSL